MQFNLAGSPNKLLLFFDSLTCDRSEGGSGITIWGGTMPSIGAQTPVSVCEWAGENRSIDRTQIISQPYTLVLADFSTIVAYSWTEAGTGTVVSTQTQFNAVFDISDMRVGQSRTYNYIASATDVAGLSASKLSASP